MAALIQAAEQETTMAQDPRSKDPQSKSVPSRPSKSQAPPPAVAVEDAERGASEVRAAMPLLEAIENERNRLMQAESLLDVVLAAMEGCEGEVDGPHFPNVIELARDLVNASIDELDAVKLKPLIRKIREETPAPAAGGESLTVGFGPHFVRDSVVYVS